MSTPNPVLVAAAPTLITALQDLQTAVNTILTGDPVQAPARVGPAIQILLGQLALLLPGLGIAELGAVNLEVNTKIGGLVTQLQAIIPKT
jgi:hypothetical protein